MNLYTVEANRTKKTIGICHANTPSEALALALATDDMIPEMNWVEWTEGEDEGVKTFTSEYATVYLIAQANPRQH